MRTPHITRKELKQDELSEVGYNLMGWFTENRQRILGILIVILVVVGGYRVTNLVIERRKAQAANDLAEARMSYLSATAILEEEQRQSEIDRTLELCKSLEAKHGSGRIGREATYLRGNCLFLSGDYDGAEQAFRQCLQNAKNAEERARAYIAIGNIYEDRYFENPDAADLLDQAREAYERGRDEGTLADGSLDYQGTFAMIELGRIETVSGNFDKALEIYRTIEEKRSGDEVFETEVDIKALQASSDGSRADQARLVSANIRELFRRYSLTARAEGHINELEAIAANQLATSGQEAPKTE